MHSRVVRSSHGRRLIRESKHAAAADSTLALCLCRSTLYHAISELREAAFALSKAEDGCRDRESNLADEALPSLGVRNDRRSRATTLSIGHDGRLAALHGSHLPSVTCEILDYPWAEADKPLPASGTRAAANSEPPCAR